MHILAQNVLGLLPSLAVRCLLHLAQSWRLFRLLASPFQNLGYALDDGIMIIFCEFLLLIFIDRIICSDLFRDLYSDLLIIINY